MMTSASHSVIPGVAAPSDLGWALLPQASPVICPYRAGLSGLLRQGKEDGPTGFGYVEALACPSGDVDDDVSPLLLRRHTRCVRRGGDLQVGGHLQAAGGGEADVLAVTPYHSTAY